MTIRYRPLLQTRAPYAWSYGGVETLTVDALRTAMAQTTVHQLSGSFAEGYDLELGMDRDSHATALDEITAVVTRFGCAFTQAFISEWVDLAVRGAVTGILVGGGATGLKTRDADATTFGASLGALIGGVAGSFVHQEVARYIARRESWSGLWNITAVPLPEPARFRFGYA